jgi:hypothetical protein
MVVAHPNNRPGLQQPEELQVSCKASYVYKKASFTSRSACIVIRTILAHKFTCSIVEQVYSHHWTCNQVTTTDTIDILYSCLCVSCGSTIRSAGEDPEEIVLISRVLYAHLWLISWASPAPYSVSGDPHSCRGVVVLLSFPDNGRAAVFALHILYQQSSSGDPGMVVGWICERHVEILLQRWTPHCWCHDRDHARPRSDVQLVVMH